MFTGRAALSCGGMAGLIIRRQRKEVEIVDRVGVAAAGNVLDAGGADHIGRGLGVKQAGGVGGYKLASAPAGADGWNPLFIKNWQWYRDSTEFREGWKNEYVEGFQLASRYRIIEDANKFLWKVKRTLEKFDGGYMRRSIWIRCFTY